MLTLMSMVGRFGMASGVIAQDGLSTIRSDSRRDFIAKE
jgi:hypothetical protein